MIDPALMPPQVQQLPRDHRGYPVPAESAWSEGLPDLGHQDYRRIGMLVSHNRCIVCGCSMVPGRRRYRLFIADEAATILAEGGKCIGYSGAGHKSCMLYSGLTCPFFASSGARRTTPELKGIPRGDRAVIMGFEKVVLGLDEGPEGLFEIWFSGACEEIWFSRPEELVPLLVQETLLNPVDLSTQMFWKDTDAVTPEWEKQADWIRSVFPAVQR